MEFWSGVWTGRIGGFAFAAARRVQGAAPVATAMTHRATELSLSLAAEELFESLPASSRYALGDVPGLLQRLQTDARNLRLRYDALNDAFVHGGVESHNAGHEGLHAARAVVQDKLRTTVAALETIRLDLLRLHAGALSLERFTTHIARAAEMSADVQRLIAARDEVEAVLQFPATLQLTPA